MRQKNKLFLLLALLLTAATGAWAQTETLLTTITATSSSYSETTPGVVTVTHDNDAFDGDYGWIWWENSGSVTVVAKDGYTITKCVFRQADKTPVTVSTAPFNINFIWDDHKGKFLCEGMDGVTSIEVYGAPAAPTYTVSLKDGVKDADKWTITPNPAEEGQTVTLTYTGRLKVKGVKATSDAEQAVTGNSVDLSTLTADYEAQDGDVLTGETTSYKVTIAAGATVTLDGVNISSTGGFYCIKCAGDATIILKDGSTNTLTSSSDSYPALTIGDANTTLTIQGSTGVLNVTSGNYCAGIGGGYKNTNYTCGNIRIEGGVITAQGGTSGSGIGTDCSTATCGDIIITGGTITAKGGSEAAGIGTGNGSNPAVCGDITIANTVTKVTATKGEFAAHSIGKGWGNGCTCGTITIGGTKYWENNAAVNGGDTYLATSPLIYDPAAPAYTLLSAATTADCGKVVCAAGHLHDAKIAVPDGCTAVGILGKVTETGHGLILALKNATNQNWNTIYGWASASYAGTTLKVLPDDAARGTNLASYTTLGSTAVSNWAVAQKSDYEAIFTNLGSMRNNGGKTYDNNVNAYITIGVGGTAMAGTYWSATEDDDYDAWFFQASSWYDDYKTSTFYVRPVLGF